MPCYVTCTAAPLPIGRVCHRHRLLQYVQLPKRSNEARFTYKSMRLWYVHRSYSKLSKNLGASSRVWGRGARSKCLNYHTGMSKMQFPRVKVFRPSYISNDVSYSKFNISEAAMLRWIWIRLCKSFVAVVIMRLDNQTDDEIHADR